MMSTAILMTAGAEQTKMRALPDDRSSQQEGLEGISFAKSFGERVGISTSSQAKSTVDDAAKVLQGVKNATPVKKPDEVADVPSGVEGKDIAAQKISARSQLNNAVAGKIIQVQARGVAEPQDKTTASNTEMKTVESPAPVEAAVDDLSSSSPSPNGTLAAGATDENPGLHLSVADGGQPLISNGGRPVIQKETEAGEKVKEGVSAKRTSKAQENAATPKAVQKATGTIVNAIAVDSRPVGERLAENATPAVGQTVASTIGLQGGTGKATDGFSAVTKPSTGVSSTAVDGQVRREGASGAKASVPDTEMALTAGSDLLAASKTGTSAEKVAAVATPVGRDGENKPQAVPGSGAVLFHSAGTVPTAVVSGNSPVELTAIKPLIGDAGSHTTSLPGGSREQDGAVAVSQSMDGAPRMLGATPTSLEVGFQNGTHGWLKVRAEMTDGGVVNASVSAASSAGQDMLHRELPGLTAYLQQEKVAVNAVSVHAPSAGGADARSSSGTEGTGGQTPQSSNEGKEQHQNFGKATWDGSDETMTYGSMHGVDEDGSLPLAAYANGGSWLSVRA